jgi:hypothetical protein
MIPYPIRTDKRSRSIFFEATTNSLNPSTKLMAGPSIYSGRASPIFALKEMIKEIRGGGKKISDCGLQICD